MKKTYFAPTSDVVQVMSQAVLQVGTTLEGQQGNETVGVGFTETEYDGEGASRRHSVWDDEG